MDSPALAVAVALMLRPRLGDPSLFESTAIAAITKHATLSLDNFSVVPQESMTALGAISVFRWSRVTSIG